MKNLVAIMTISLAFAGVVNAANLSSVKNIAGHLTLEDSIIRKRIFMAEFPVRNVSSVDVREITFKPKQKTGRHQHPIPVMGYVVSGTVLFEADGQSARVLHADKQKASKVSHMMTSLKKNDILEVKIRDNEYTLFKVDHVDGNLVYVAINKFQTNMESGISDLKDKEFDNSVIKEFPVAQLLQNNNFEIIDIDRK